MTNYMNLNCKYKKLKSRVNKVENKVAAFEETVKQAKVAASSIKSEEEEKLQEIKRKRAIEEGIELEKAKYEVKMKFEKAEKLASGGGAGAKLPKLIITKFQGTHLDWMRFWNQYETEIDKSNITQVAKLSYWRELLVPSAKVLIEGLPFTSEGYERAKTILDSLRERYPAEVAEIEKCLYGDDIISGGCTTDEVSSLKETTVSMFEAAKFQLDKWHSNESKLESSEEDSDLQGNNQPSYAKQQLGVQSDETKLLGLPWNKSNDTLAVGFPTKPAETTRREILRFLASIYDPLGIVSPVTLVGKMIFREACDRHLPWDEKLSDNLGQKWLKFLKNLPEQLQFQRSIPEYREPIDEIELHSFGDASGSGASAAVHAVVKQRSGASVGLIAAKSRLAKKNLTIPRLELVSAHMAANLADNVRIALDGYPVKAVYGWLDSLVALYWIRGTGTYKQFVTNRVSKINAKEFIVWRHIGTDLNPADRQH